MRFILCAALFACSILDAKVLIITHSYNQPEFIEWQDKTFKKFFKNEYEFVVFNDAPQAAMEQSINDTCERLGLRCIRIPQEIHTRPYLFREPGENLQHPCCRASNVIQYSLDELGFAHDDFVIIIDSDMFFIRDFDLYDYMKDADLAGTVQYRGTQNEVVYLYSGLLFFNMPKLPNVRTFCINSGNICKQPCDVGGFSYYYLRDNKDLRVKFFPETVHLPLGQRVTFTPASKNTPIFISEEALMHRAAAWPHIQKLLQHRPDYIQFFVDFSVLHYACGSNHNNKSAAYHEQKKNAIRAFINEICAH